MKHRVVNFPDKFEDVSDGYINEEFINCDSFDENNGFIKEEENINGNISENDIDNQGSTNCAHGDERAHNVRAKRFSRTPNYVHVNQSKHL